MIKTRFAPSPTGYLHIGGARTALFSWLYARSQGGRFVLRIEDTDRERSTEASVQAILDGMQWLGLDWDEGPIFQSERGARYREVLQQLLDSDQAYHCYCSREALDEMRAEQQAAGQKPRYDGRCRHRTAPEPDVSPVVRLRSPQEGDVVFDDQIRGEIRISNAELDDLILARSDGSPTYNFTVVVDDADMGITHVIRGDDHINNTPRQINILKAMGAELPVYAHVPMILGGDGKRLSKRHGAVSVMQFAEEGILPEALLNALVRLGWSHGDEEIFSVQDMLQKFSLQHVQKSAAAFSQEKLLWLNQHYLKTLPLDDVQAAFLVRLAAAGLQPDNGVLNVQQLTAIQRERCKDLNEMVEQSRFFFADIDAYDDQAANKFLTDEASAVLKALESGLSSTAEWSAEALNIAVRAVAEQMDIKLGKVAQPLRVALAGSAVSPSIDATLELLGRERSLQRIRRAIDFIDAR